MRVKGVFFQKVQCIFKSLNLQKKIFQKTILNMKFKILANNSKALMAGNLNFKLRIVFLDFSFWRFGDLKKRITLSEKKPPLVLATLWYMNYYLLSKNTLSERM